MANYLIICLLNIEDSIFIWYNKLKSDTIT